MCLLGVLVNKIQIYYLHLYINQLTPSRRFLLAKLTVPQLVKKVLALYGNRRFIIMLKTARQLFLSSARII
jgi:hypothetical protein